MRGRRGGRGETEKDREVMVIIYVLPLLLTISTSSWDEGWVGSSIDDSSLPLLPPPLVEVVDVLVVVEVDGGGGSTGISPLAIFSISSTPPSL